MKKRSLLALSLISLVALVGCGGNNSGGGSKKKGRDYNILSTFVGEFFGRELAKGIEPLEDVLPTWAEEDAKSEWVSILGGDTSAELSAELLYNEMFVPYEEEGVQQPAPMDQFLAEFYAEEYSAAYSNPVSLAQAGVYVGLYDFEYDDEYVELFIQIQDVAGIDEETGEAYAETFMITIASLFDQI